MFETSRSQTASKSIQRLPVIKELSNKQKDKKNFCSKTSLYSQISFPKLKAKNNVSLISNKKSATDFQATALSESLKCVQNVEQLIAEKDFENCSDVCGLTECQTVFKVPSSEIYENEFETENEKLEESNALKRWEFWTKDRIRLQNHLSKHLKRNHCDLQLNGLDKFRQKVEDRTLFEYSQIPNADKWRGHPYHWKSPLCLNNKKGEPDLDFEGSPRYYAVKSKLEEGEIPEMEFIGVPLAIQKEKGLACKSVKSPKKDRERTSYEREQTAHFLKKNKRLNPRGIQIDELAVVGMKIPQKQEEPSKPVLTEAFPEICITLDEEEPKECFDYRQSIFCLDIQGKEMKYEIGTDDCQNPDIDFTWEIDFGVNTVGCLVDKVLRVENRGTVAVRYDWLSKNIKQNLDLDSMNTKQREPWFFFDKNSGVFLPGQIYDLKFYCHAKYSGIRREVWYIKTNPPLSQSQELGTIVLSVMATKEFLDEREALGSYLRGRVRDSTVDFIIQILLYNVFSPTRGLRDIEYRSLFSEKQLFENHNQKYYYHSANVRTLKVLFQEIPSKNQTEWDLSLDTLVTLVQTYKEGKEKASLFSQIANEAKKLLRPTYVSVKNVKKYRMVFQILCCMTNFVEEDYESSRNLFLQKEKEQSEEKIDLDMDEEESWNTNSLESEESRYSHHPKVTNDLMQMIFYIKIHKRVCVAVEQIAGALETNKLFQSGPQYDYKLEKSSRTNPQPIYRRILCDEF